MDDLHTASAVKERITRIREALQHYEDGMITSHELCGNITLCLARILCLPEQDSYYD